MSCGMGFVENHLMQAKSTNVVSSRVQSDGFVVEMEKPKYKRRRVLGVRTFPPGCGPNADPIPGNLANPVTESKSHGLAVSGGEDGDPVALENGSDGLKQDMDSVALDNGDNAKDVLEKTDHDESKVDTMPDGEEVSNDVMMENGSNACGDDSLEQMDHVKCDVEDEMLSPDDAHGFALENHPGVDSPAESLLPNNAELSDPDKEAVIQKYPPRRKVSGVRDFPPNCGRNAKPPSTVEGQEEIEMDAGAQQDTSGSDVPERNGGHEVPKLEESATKPDEALKGKVLVRKSSLVKRRVARKSVITPREYKKSFSLGKKLSQNNQTDENHEDSQEILRNGGSTTSASARHYKKSFSLGKKLSQNNQTDENHDDSQEILQNGGSTSSAAPASSRGSDAERTKVQEILRLFHSLCKIFEEEGKSNPGKRVDFLAAKELKSRKMNLNAGQHIIGAVRGVEVGDEFQYRLELNIIGLHRPTQGGIDYTKQPRGIIATSVVASGGYDDNLDNSNVLEYTGQGGVSTKDKQAEDQKLERGNLALKNSVTVKNPVRVVRGRNRMTADGKVGKVYVYDGLYTVEADWQETGPQGKLVFKFRLVRMSGQPELTWKQSTNSKKTAAF
ncbi:Histone-lysine N-methyltransferase, H3 lysine-9 specific SUVH5 [Linum grandiflorum]